MNREAPLPEGRRPLESEEDVRRRIRGLRDRYEPFTRNLSFPVEARGRSRPLNPWEFRWRGDRTWRRIRLPEWKGRTHWEGEYRLSFEVPKELRDFARILLHFGGVETTVTAVLNGRTVGEHTGGSDPFYFDVSDAVHRDVANRLHLHVVNGLAVNGIEYPRTFSREPFRGSGVPYKLVGEWGSMHGREGRAGGIWRDVTLVGTADAWIEGALVEPEPEKSRVRVRVETGSKRDLAGGRPEAAGGRPGTLRIEILPRNFRGRKTTVERDLRIGPGASVETAVVIDLQEQRWWSPREPYLYTARVALLEGDTVLDSGDFTFGQRSFRYDPSIQRYRLNGRPFRFRGTSTINSLNMAYLAGDRAGLVDQILLAKAAGFNMLRHHIMSPVEEVDEYLDMYGMLSQPEMPVWGRFHPDLVETAVEQLPRILRQHYNHPSTVLFALSSESATYRSSYAAYQKRAVEIVERDFPLMEWKIEGVCANLGGIPGRRSPEGDLLEYQDGLFDVHEYAGWYVNLGSLEPVRKGGPLMTVGEFGPESLSNLSTMQSSWPEGTYPADPDAPAAREELPCGRQYGWAESRWFLPTPRTLRGWIEATQTHSAFVHGYQTAIFRRSPAVLGYHQYFLNEPVWNTWRKTLCGVDLSPKAPYFAMAAANEPVLLDLFSDRERYLPRESVTVRVFLVNDAEEDIRDGELRLLLVGPEGAILRREERTVSAPMAVPVEVGAMEVKSPQITEPGPYSARASLLVEGKNAADAEFRFRVVDPAVWPVDRPALRSRVLHLAGGDASLEVGRRLAEEMGRRWRCLPLADAGLALRGANGAAAGVFYADILIVDSVSDWRGLPTDALRGHLENGGRLLLAELEPCSLDWLVPGLGVAADPLHALFRPDENHPIFGGRAGTRLTSDDFRLWNYVPVRRALLPQPAHPYAGHRTRDLVDCPIRFRGREFDRVAHISGDDRIRLFSVADADRRASALLEIRWGEGCVLISQARLFGRCGGSTHHPLARILFHRMVDYLATVRRNQGGGETGKFDVIQRF